MKKVKITILKTTLNEELAREYGAVGIKACPMMKEGDVFMTDYAKPEGFCDEAWKAITSICSRSPMVRAATCSITAIGSGNLVSPS